jgi:hypothetical protein
MFARAGRNHKHFKAIVTMNYSHAPDEARRF